VKEIPLTTKIINEIMPYFPKSCVCISGHLDNSDQYWKVNYHWDLLTSKVDEFLAMPAVSEEHKKAAQKIKTLLQSNPPSPKTGYKTDKTVGATKDKSTPERIVARHKTMKQSKLDFEALLIAAKVVTASSKANPPADEKMWWLAVAPLRAPGTSNHGTGYALDIFGNNVETTRISLALGATLAYNEASHVHVEWAKGVKVK
jgi:hypothetical protein